MPNYTYKDFKESSRWLMGYKRKSIFEKLIFNIIAPIKYLKFKKIIKGDDINNERLNR